eukprot:gb/GECH01000544.1/.p1 GENE.gb/GECH01000544.1/~~gb/GECH01000544.1/.p1  ORF type:complete len:170 (+),score=45.68 gb/GECH01000544.1/:1-510(+)
MRHLLAKRSKPAQRYQVPSAYRGVLEHNPIEVTRTYDASGTHVKTIKKSNLPHALDYLNQVDLKYPIRRSAEELQSDNPTGFQKPLGILDPLPFHVKRTGFAQIPVYIDYRNGRTRVLTIVRKIEGDMRALREELEKITQTHVEQKQGRLQVKGNHSPMIKTYLRALGF